MGGPQREWRGLHGRPPSGWNFNPVPVIPGCRGVVGVPSAVVQYNDWKGGGIVAVNYEARAKGVTRMMRGDEAKKQARALAG